MKILKLLSYYSPENIAGMHLLKDAEDAFIKNGITVEVCAPTPSRGISAKVRKEYKAKKHEVLHDGKLIINRFSMYAEPKNSLMRAFRYTLCIIRQFFYGLTTKDVDIYFAGSTPPINGLIMFLLKKIKKFKIAYNLQDVFPDSMINAGMTKKGSIIWKIGRIVENITYKSADKIIVISQDFKRNIMAKGVPEEKIEVVYNWVDENTVMNIPRNENKLCEKYGIDKDKFIITYSGNIGHSQNLELLVQAAEKLSENKDIMFVIIGEGACKENLIFLQKEKNLENIVILPFQDYSDISHVFSLGDCGLVISKKGIGEASVPSKTWSIMSAQRAVLASFDKGTELDEIITENNCGICVDSDNCDALVDAINTLYSDKEAVKKMGENGRKYIENNLTKEICTAKYVKLLKSM